MNETLTLLGAVGTVVTLTILIGKAWVWYANKILNEETREFSGRQCAELEDLASRQGEKWRWRG